MTTQPVTVFKPVPVFTRADVEPTDALIDDHLGEAFDAWRELIEVFTSEFGLQPTWRFYRDGGWLCKSLKGKKNQAWLGVWSHEATATFYFAERHRDGLVALDIPEELRLQVSSTTMVGAMLPVQIVIRDHADVNSCLTVMRHKLSVK
ncbi:MAG: DUF3788 domain-containing protein [Propionibacteriaceae bacterium]|nr:DUF3788 domain-containing protein [Propionibacteriaceae bacterium]